MYWQTRPHAADVLAGGRAEGAPSAGGWWLVTRPLAQAVEAAGEVVVTDGWSDWWYTKGERPEAVLESLGLAEFLG